jgi:putative hemolysin
MLILLICSALISGSEVAFFSLSPKQISDLRSADDRGSIRVLKLLEHPIKESALKRLLATILIANNFVNIALVLLSAYVAEAIFPPNTMDPLLEILIHVVAVTFVIVLFGEVIPKVYATNNNVTLSRFMSLPISLASGFFKPISLLLIWSTKFIDRKVANSSSESISVDELGHALELTNTEERTEEEQKILEGIVNFGLIDVKQIMTSRIDITSFEIGTPYPELIQGIVGAGYSRIPIYQNSLDEIVGILYIKDLLPHLHKEKFDWEKLIRSPFFVPENKKIDDLLREFQNRKIHVAIVVDEYGGTSGLISLEDVIEEIVGEITDEFDEEDLQYSKIDSSNYVFEGKTALVDMYRVLEIDGGNFESVKGESDTLAGFVVEQSGKIPLKGEKITFEHYTFTIESADKRKVKRIKVTIKDELETE